MQFTLRQIQIFSEAAKDQNFRKTADRLDISQPAISKHIRLLEERAGGKLFHRGRGSSAKLSPLGKELLSEANALLRNAGNVSDSDQLARTNDAQLRIASGEYLLDRWLRPAVRRLYAIPNMPDFKLIGTDDISSIFSLLREGEVDVGFYTGKPYEDADLRTDTLREASVGLYAAAGLAAEYGDDPAKLSQAPMIMTTEGSRTDEWQRATLATNQIRPQNVVARSQYIDIALDLVLSGTGFALLFDDDAREYTASGQLVRYPFEFVDGYRCMTTRKQVRAGPRKASAIKNLREILKGD